MTLAASATADFHERSRLLLARPECVVGMQPPPAPPAPGPRVPMVEVPFSYNQTLTTRWRRRDHATGAGGGQKEQRGRLRGCGRRRASGLYLFGGPGVHLS